MGQSNCVGACRCCSVGKIHGTWCRSGFIGQSQGSPNRPSNRETNWFYCGLWSLIKVWFGGSEPCQNSGVTILCCLFPFLVPFLLSPSKDKLIDRPDFWSSGLCYGFNIDKPQKEELFSYTHLLYLIYGP